MHPRESWGWLSTLQVSKLSLGLPGRLSWAQSSCGPWLQAAQSVALTTLCRQEEKRNLATSHHSAKAAEKVPVVLLHRPALFGTVGKLRSQTRQEVSRGL